MNKLLKVVGSAWLWSSFSAHAEDPRPNPLSLPSPHRRLSLRRPRLRATSPSLRLPQLPQGQTIQRAREIPSS